MYYFPLTPRLQRLYTSKATASHMRWHAEHEVEEGVMHHCSDAPAWKHFDKKHPSFSEESRNVRLGLSTDEFQPFGQTGKQYSSWPVIVTPYNLPPWMCMKDPYLFLSVIVPGPKNPKQQLDVFLQPLIAELKNLWNIGVNTYDISKKQNFKMRAALMWTISDFPSYSMFSGSSTAGRLACPYCKENSDAFTLTKGGKQSWFDNHREDVLKEIDELGLKKVTELGADIINRRISKFSGWKKRSIFWDLPYWSTNLIRHNLDVMHIEKNFFENVFNTVLDVDGKTKDNPKSREDLKEFCRRPELHVVDGKYPKAIYTLKEESKKLLCEWVKNLKFPDGYVSNMGRCVDMKKHKLFGMKSHDCHVFMQRLVPIAFRELLPKKVWEALTEMSLFFRDVTSTVIREEDMVRLQQEIPEILCKLECVFPPSFFDSMEHLLVHLAYEAMLADPVQYRWMYPFERNLQKYKYNIRNKAHVEGCICNAYRVEEASSFCSHYFEPHVYTRHRKVPRNDDGGIGEQDGYNGNLSIFTYPGRGFGELNRRYLTEEELKAAHIYILLNCREVQPYVEKFIDSLHQNFPRITEQEVDKKLDEDFASWFTRYARVHIDNQFIKALAEGPCRSAKPYTGYNVNDFKFHTKGRSFSRASNNSGVCIKGTNYSADDNDYYGVLTEILELEYKGSTLIKKTVLFKCEWFDPTPNVGMKIHPQYKLVDINHKRKLKKYEPFVLAMQAAQVYYASYPSLRRDKSDWWAVCKTKARGIVVMPLSYLSSPLVDDAEPFQCDENGLRFDVVSDSETIVRNDPNGEFINLRDEDDNLDDETEFHDELELESDDENENEEAYYESGSE
ncbi:uncharacterized protein LOC125852871 [Solanum stenotomum]|uniref:uncharacterized protein LOC125852871 n=1 Tax=Solanum stenotomum TaxID=172797 RepID=UPI0020D0E0A9|nr:uncharacterized protein LOC125852871 [Solanum stenotomum]